MTTFELNQYLRANVKCTQGDFLSGKTEGGRYAVFRNDAHIIPKIQSAPMVDCALKECNVRSSMSLLYK